MLFYCLFISISEVFGVKVNGLKITQWPSNTTLSSQSSTASPLAKERKRDEKKINDLFHLVNYLKERQEYDFPEAETEEMEVSFVNSELSEQSQEEAPQEKKDAGKQENDKLESSTPFIRGRQNSPGPKLVASPQSKNEKESTGLESNNAKENTKNICRVLAKDALEMATCHHDVSTRERTTCFCVLLYNQKKKCLKRVVFFNGIAKPAPLKQWAEKSNNENIYEIHDPKNGHGGHAEKAFVEYLIAENNKPDKEKFTHLLGMGCSRQHCKECDTLLRMFLGANYDDFTAAPELVIDGKKQRPEMSPKKEDSRDYDFVLTTPMSKYLVTILYSKSAVKKNMTFGASYPVSKAIIETMNMLFGKKFKIAQQAEEQDILTFFYPTSEPGTQKEFKVLIDRFKLDVSIWKKVFGEDPSPSS